MRDVKRIKRMLNKLERIWVSMPDLRFGQLLINLGISPDSIQFWVVEDEKTEEQLDKNKLSKYVKKEKI